MEYTYINFLVTWIIFCHAILSLTTAILYNNGFYPLHAIDPHMADEIIQEKEGIDQR